MSDFSVDELLRLESSLEWTHDHPWEHLDQLHIAQTHIPLVVGQMWELPAYYVIFFAFVLEVLQ